MVSLKVKSNYAKSIEDTSVLRKFTILFLLMSVIPLMVLWYFHYQIRKFGSIQLTESEFNITLTFVLLGIITGYLSMRAVLKKLIHVTIQSTNSLRGVLSSNKLEELNEEKNEIDVLSKAFKVVTSRLEDNIKSLEIAKKTLSAVMTKVGQGLANAENIDSFLELILETITNALDGQMGILMLYNEDEKVLSVKCVFGIEHNVQDEILIKTTPGTSMHSVTISKKPVILDELTSDLDGLAKRGFFATPLICAPLITQDKLYGVVAISGDGVENRFGGDEMSILLSLASQTAVAIENSHLSKNIETTYFETISALALAVDAKDRYSRGHLDRVANFCLQIAEKMGHEPRPIQ